MKKLFEFMKKNIIGFTLGLIVAGTGAYAASVIAASEVTYSNTSSGLSSTNVKGAIDELNTKATTKIAEAKKECPSGNVCFFAKPGDYVKMTPTSTSYTITAAMTGYDSNQTINPSELNLWRVISLNKDGTIDLVSEYVSSTKVYFKGKIGYQNCISSLNQIAAQYTNSKYTVASRHMGYNGQTEKITSTSVLDSTTPQMTASTSYLTISAASESAGLGDMGYEKDYSLINSVLGASEAKQVGTTTTASNWLASRLYVYNSSTHWEFSCRASHTNGIVGIYNFLVRYYDSSYIPASVGYAVRPIITLKSGLSPSSGSGTSSSPYVLS